MVSRRRVAALFVSGASVSVADLKGRLSDVPGIENLTMQILLGRQVFGFNGLIAAVDPMATDQEIETAIRDANATLYPSPGHSTTPLPIVNLTEPKPMSAPSPTGFVPGEISSLFKSLRARKDAMVADIMANGAEVAATIATGEQMSAALKAEGEAMKAELGIITNFPPE